MKRILPLVLLPLLFASCASGPKKIKIVNVTEREREIRREVKLLTETTDTVIIDGRKYRKYKLKKGDSLWKVAKVFFKKGTYWKILAGLNKIQEPYFLREGKTLLVPLILNYKEIEKAGGKKNRFKYRTVRNKCFGVGEKLVYAVKYFNITAGYGILDIKEMAEIRGREAYHIVATAKTSEFFETFYRVRDVIESYMDARGLFSLKYSKTLEEGSYRAFSAIEFFHPENKAIKHTKEEYKIPAFVNDVLSELYYYRTFDLSPGKNDEVWIDVCADDGKSYQIVVKKLGYEKVSVDAGEFDCIKVQPHLKYEGIFRQKGDVIIWLTNDENKIPVKVESKIIIGSIDAVLQHARIVKPD